MNHQQRATAADGTSIAWSRTGSGDAVVLVHGITESADSFSPGHRTSGVDQRGDHARPAWARRVRHRGVRMTSEPWSGDVAAVIEAAQLQRPHLVGHSLGGAVVTAAGSALDVASIVDIDQSLQLDAFKAQLMPAEAMLRDPDQYQLVVDAMFEMMMGVKLSADEQARINGLRHADHEVVLGVWELLLTQPVEDIAATVDAALAGYAGRDVPYLALFGLDPGDGYCRLARGTDRRLDGRVLAGVRPLSAPRRAGPVRRSTPLLLGVATVRRRCRRADASRSRPSRPRSGSACRSARRSCGARRRTAQRHRRS